MSARLPKIYPLPDDDPRHGTVNGYGNCRCRCQPCRDAWAQFCRDGQERRSRALATGLSITHGTENGYGNYKCRCEECTKAWSAAKLARSHRRRARIKA